MPQFRKSSPPSPPSSATRRRSVARATSTPPCSQRSAIGPRARRGEQPAAELARSAGCTRRRRVSSASSDFASPFSLAGAGRLLRQSLRHLLRVVEVHLHRLLSVGKRRLELTRG